MQGHAFSKNKSAWIVGLSAAGILFYLLTARALPLAQNLRDRILIVVVVIGGAPMIYDILKDLARGELGADALAVISIITSFILKEYLAGSIIVFMLAGGSLLESYAVHSASSVLNALLKRMPKAAHRKSGAQILDIAVPDIRIGDVLVVFPHEIVPVDGAVIEGHGFMDESYLTGEPFLMSKAPGSEVFSGAINGEVALVFQAGKEPKDSRYAKIMEVMRAAEEKRPHLRRLADQLGGIYTPVSLVLAALAWYVSKDAGRFLAVVVVATPCPLIIGIPVAIIGAISLAAKRGIIVKNPLALEQIQLCRTAIYDKTGTLTYGEPALVEQNVTPGVSGPEILQLAASLERYSKHPLAKAIQAAAREASLAPMEVSELSEKPGQGLSGVLQGKRVQIAGRRLASSLGQLPASANIPSGGLECFVLVDGQLAAGYHFRDAPRSESPAFVKHLGPRHAFERQMIISGDRESDVRYLADAVGIAIGQNSDVTAEAASVVVMENSLRLVDEFMHISERMRRIALQSAVGGMLLSVVAMIVAASGFLPPVAGAITQEIIDMLAVANALRVAFPPHVLADV